MAGGSWVTFAAIYSVAVTLPTIGVILLALRIYSARHSKRRLQADDYLAGVSSFLTVAIGTILIVGAAKGLIGGRDSIAWPKRDDRLTRFYKFNYILPGFNIPALGTIRLSLLCLYLRLFRTRYIRTTIQISIGVVIVWTICWTIWAMAICGNHPSAYWSASDEIHNEYCMPASDIRAVIVLSVTDCSLDMLVLLLPLYPIWHLNLPLLKKAGLSVIFMFGTVSCAAAWICAAHSIRANIITDEPRPFDRMGLYSTYLWWSFLEISLGNMVCNLPVLSGYIIRRFFASPVTSVKSWITPKPMQSTAYESDNEDRDSEIQVGYHDYGNYGGVQGGQVKNGTGMGTTVQVEECAGPIAPIEVFSTGQESRMPETRYTSHYVSRFHTAPDV